MEKLVKKTILVTGGFGYLGGRIAQTLSKQGYRVILGSSRTRVSPSWMPQAEVVKLNWNNEDDLTIACSEVDMVIHTAGMNAKDCEINSVEAINFNGVITARLVNATIAAGVSKFIYLSTAHVYCSPLVGKVTEESCLKNLHPYATSHISGENSVLYQTNKRDDFIGIVLRLSNGVGFPAHKNANCWMLAVNDFCRQVVESGRIVINSPRWIERDYFPISLLCKTIISLSDNCKVDGSIVNVASSKAINLQEIARIITERAEKTLLFSPEIIYRSGQINKSGSNLLISNNKLKKILKVESDLNPEIDQLLLRCKKWFSN